MQIKDKLIRRLPSTYAPASVANIPMGVLAGILVGILCGVGFGFLSVALEMRVPFVTIAIGYAVGYAVLAASKEPGTAQGIIAGICAGASTLLGLFILFCGTGIVSVFGMVFALYAVYRAYTIAAG